ncbi:UDP-glucose 4-epimerase family protein [Pseudomonas putida]
MVNERVLVTGATGFIGHPLCIALEQGGYSVVRCQRPGVEARDGSLRYFDLESPGTLPLVSDVDVIIHTAARVHVMRGTSASDLHAFRLANVDATLRLARHAAANGVRRFIYLSSIKVNGEFSRPGKPFRADDDPQPSDPYGISKCEAEAALRTLATQSDMKVVIIRPPLVYGPGVRANFQAMMRWVRLGIPLPFAGLDNRRSLVYLDNLLDFIVTCVGHPGAANQTFLVADAGSLSTTELLRQLSGKMGRRSRLFVAPMSLISCLAAVLGKREAVKRLYGSLEVDIAKSVDLLGWQPPIATLEGLAITVKAYSDQQEK